MPSTKENWQIYRVLRYNSTSRSWHRKFLKPTFLCTLNHAKNVRITVWYLLDCKILYTCGWGLWYCRHYLVAVTVLSNVWFHKRNLLFPFRTWAGINVSPWEYQWAIDWRIHPTFLREYLDGLVYLHSSSSKEHIRAVYFFMQKTLCMVTAKIIQ